MAQGKKTGGRKRGTPNTATREIKTLAARLLNDKTYLRNLRIRLRLGEAGPVEVMLYHYAYGQPSKKVEHSGKVTLEQIVAGPASTDEDHG